MQQCLAKELPPPTESSNMTNYTQNRIANLITNIKESATLAVDTKAKSLKQAGKPVISFGAGEPDFPTPQHIVEAAIVAAKNPKNHHYSPTSGLPQLREAIAHKTLRDSNYQINPTQILVTNGGKQAVHQAFATLLNPQDEVLLPTPFWTSYPEIIRLANGVPVEIFANATENYKITTTKLEKALTPKTKILIFTSPSNPTGAVYSPEETREIGLWAAKNNLWVITDEIYEHLVYEDTKFTSIATVTPELENKIIILNGVAKTYAMTGWRVGWMAGPTDIIKAATNLQSHTTSHVCNIAQQAAIAAITGSLDIVKDMRYAFNERRKKLTSELNKIPNTTTPTPKGAFYAYTDVSKILQKNTMSIKTSSELAKLILEKTNVAVVPGEAFGPSGFLRLSYALNEKDLLEGAHRLQNFLNEIQK